MTRSARSAAMIGVLFEGAADGRDKVAWCVDLGATETGRKMRVRAGLEHPEAPQIGDVIEVHDRAGRWCFDVQTGRILERRS
jgi:hypothetical protein